MGPDIRNVRQEADIFADLAELCASPGFIHAIAYLSFRENLVPIDNSLSPEDLNEASGPNALLRGEISTLIGLLVRKPINFKLPKPEKIQDYIDRAERLLDELHKSLANVWFADFDMESVEEGRFNPFAKGVALREPIFYGGESAFHFQYRDFARLKYKNDDGWLRSKKGFSIFAASDIVAAIGDLQIKKVSGAVDSFRHINLEEWEMVTAFSFNVEEVSEISGARPDAVRVVLDSFSVTGGNANGAFLSLDDFNEANACPIIKKNDEEYVLLQHYSLVESLYESPFFWMLRDSDYRDVASHNRGAFTEELVASRLSSVFGADNVFTNVDVLPYEGGDSKKIGEIDVLVVFAGRLICVQAKSKRLTIASRKGSEAHISKDFKAAIQDAADQASTCARAILNGAILIDRIKRKIQTPHAIVEVFPLCIVCDHYPALAFQVRQFLEWEEAEGVRYPLSLDVFALDVAAELLDTPLYFINYLSVRSRFRERLHYSHESDLIGLYLARNIWIDDEYAGLNIDGSIAHPVNAAMMVRREGLPGARVPEGMLTRFVGTPYDGIICQLRSSDDPVGIEIGCFLLQVNENTINALNAGLDRISTAARADGACHDVSVTFGSAAAGVTVHCGGWGGSKAIERLKEHCEFRKYYEKAKIWYGLRIDPATGRFEAALKVEGAWIINPHFDRLLSERPVQRHSLATLRKTAKVGRNERCPCGSGLKFKKCCLDRS